MDTSLPVSKYHTFDKSRSLDSSGPVSLGTQNSLSLEKLRYDRQSAAEMLSISIRSLDYRISTGQIRARRDGSKVLIPHAELVRYARTDHPLPVRRTTKSSTALVRKPGATSILVPSDPRAASR